MNVAVVYFAVAIAMFVVLRLQRRALLNFRFALGWFLLLFTLAIFVGLVSLTVDEEIINFAEPVTQVSFTMVVVFLVISIQLSVSICGMLERIRILSEEVALLKMQSISTTQSDR